MKDYSTRPSRVVNLKTIRGMNGIQGNAKAGLTIGALVTLTQLEEHPIVRANFPGLAEAAHSIATPQIRNLGERWKNPVCYSTVSIARMFAGSFT